MASAWIFLGTSDPAEGWRTEFIFVVILTAALSLSLNMRMAYEPAVPTTISSEGKVLLNREWGRRRALLISVSYGKMTAYMSGFTAPAEGSGVKVRAAVFDFKRAEKGAGFDEYLYWKSKGAVKKIIPLELEVTSPPAGIHRWRNFLKAKIEGSLPDLMSGYMLALTLGIRDRFLTERHMEPNCPPLAVSGFMSAYIPRWRTLLKSGRTKILAISVLNWSILALRDSRPEE
jgi:competence protein ComEC